MEHRWGRRVEADTPVRLTCRPYAVGSGRIRNLSVSGAFIETPLELPLLARVNVIVAEWAEESFSEPDEIVACVVRTDVDGIAVEWCELAPAAVVRLLGETVAARAVPREASSLPLRARG